jgi:uncharacterized protein YbcC (UPF0753/DUF2309 family)
MHDTHNGKFDVAHVLHTLRHYLPAQAPLKDFIHHNTLHAFQHLPFYNALLNASEVFGYKVSLSLQEYRNLFAEGRIDDEILTNVIIRRKGDTHLATWKRLLKTFPFHIKASPRIGQLRAHWKTQFHIDLDSMVHPLLFRLLCSYLDQGISIWQFPVTNKGFLAALRKLEKNSLHSLFRHDRARKLLIDPTISLDELLRIVVGEEEFFERYLFDQQFAHQGWSGMVCAIEDNVDTLLDKRSITLHDLIFIELLLEIDALDQRFGEIWSPLSYKLDGKPIPLFENVKNHDFAEVLFMWQEALEWSFHDQVLAGLQNVKPTPNRKKATKFQALFCIDDRECSIRRYIEQFEPECETFGTPGFFGVEFFFQPMDGKFLTKLCPAPVTPKYLIKEIGKRKQLEKDHHFNKHSHSFHTGYLISQTLGFWSAAKLFFNLFKPSMSPATASSFRHMDKASSLTVENKHSDHIEKGLQVGFTIEEMAVRVENVLKSIGLVHDFAPLVYVVGHGSSSVNNPHYAAYDCGACSGRAGSVNARAFCHMANHPSVRQILAHHGIIIPDNTRFVGALHDTTRDEIMYFDEESLPHELFLSHQSIEKNIEKALDFNAKERSRRFVSVNSNRKPEQVHESIRLRSVSLFEPRPELNHATNAVCIVGRRALSKGLFLDRRSFLNSYDYSIDPDGKYLYNILKAAAPVCGGINLEYYFSRVDNQKLGAGTKLPHNVMGLFGVANGIDGDLRPGLPSQMIEVHDPLRLMIVVEHLPDIVDKTIQTDPSTYEWFANNWIHLVAIHPENRQLYRYENKQFVPYNPLTKVLNHTNNIAPLIATKVDNFPVYIIQHEE